MHSNRLDHSLMFHERQYRVCIFACWEDTFAQWHKRHKLTDTRKGQEERTSLSMGLQHLTSPEKKAGSGGSQATTPSEEAALFTQQSALGSHTFLSLERNFYSFILKNLKTMLINATRKNNRITPWKQIWRGVGEVGARSGHTQRTFDDSIQKFLQPAPASTKGEGGPFKPDWELWSHTAAEGHPGV